MALKSIPQKKELTPHEEEVLAQALEDAESDEMDKESVKRVKALPFTPSSMAEAAKEEFARRLPRMVKLVKNQIAIAAANRTTNGSL
jgi:hypothetical protein